MIKKLFSRGDTIVEVLIAIAVVSVVLGAAYVSSSHSLRDTRQAQEHTEALKLAESQLEMLRSASSDATTPTIFTYLNYFCMTGDNSAGIQDATAPTVLIGTTFPALNSAGDNFTYNNPCMFPNGITYNAAIDRVESPAGSGNFIFTVHIRWDSIQGTGHDEVSLMYKLDH